MSANKTTKSKHRNNKRRLVSGNRDSTQERGRGKRNPQDREERSQGVSLCTGIYAISPGWSGVTQETDVQGF